MRKVDDPRHATLTTLEPAVSRRRLLTMAGAGALLAAATARALAGTVGSTAD